MAMQPHAAMQQHGSQQQTQQAGYSPASGPGMYAQQDSMQRQAGLYPGIAQAYPSSAGQHLPRPMSPSCLPQGCSHPAMASQQPQIKDLTRQFIGSQMITPATMTNPMIAQQLVAKHTVGGQTAGKQMVGHQMMTGQMAGGKMAGYHLPGNQMVISSTKSPSARQAASLQSAVAFANSAMLHAAAHSQAAQQDRYPSSSHPYMMHGEMPSLLTLPSAYQSADHTTLLLMRRPSKPITLLVPSMTADAHTLTMFHSANRVA